MSEFDLITSGETNAALSLAHLESSALRTVRAQFVPQWFVVDKNLHILCQSDNAHSHLSQLGYADLLYTQVSDEDNLQCIDTIRRNGFHLIELLDDILDLSRIEAHKLNIEITEFSPVALLERIRELMQVRADQQGIVLSVEYPDKVPALISNDSTRLRQILVNIVGNAIKFTEQGNVNLSLAYLDEEPPAVEFTVTDTGIGMSPEQLKVVFGAFDQADSTISRRYGGTGLGLTICSRLVKRLGGQLSVDSEPDAGTTLRVSFPLGLSTPVVLETANRQSGNVFARQAAIADIRLPHRILVVDDRQDVLNVVTQMLEQAGAQVRTARNGKQALDTFSAASAGKEPFEALILDMHMPLMNGFEVVRQLRSDGVSTPIIALTADAMKGGREKCLLAGCSDYITKPIDRQLFLKTLCGHLGSSGQHNTSAPDTARQGIRQPASDDNSKASQIVLIVEDHAPSAEVLAKLLSRYGYQVYTALSVAQARQHLKHIVPDIILSDIGLPEEDGFTFLQSLQQQAELASCFTIALSGRDLAKEEKSELFDAHIRKPVDMKLLLKLIEQRKSQDPTTA